MKRKNTKEIVSLPLSSGVKRRALWILRAIYNRLQRLFGGIDGWLLKRLEYIERRAALPEGTLVSQHEHDHYDEEPWKVIHYTGDDYKLAHAEGKEVFTPSGVQESHIYVYSKHIRVLRNQTPRRPSPILRFDKPKRISRLN